MMKSHLAADVVGVASVVTIVATQFLTPTPVTQAALYASLLVLFVYSYLTFEYLPKRQARRAQALALANRKVLRLPVSSEMENHRGKYRTDRGIRPPLSRAAGA
jgi:hypothetical protein